MDIPAFCIHIQCLHDLPYDEQMQFLDKNREFLAIESLCEVHGLIVVMQFISSQILYASCVALIDLTERISVRVIDPFTIKPLDVKTIIDHTRATRGRILTVEDHYYEGRFS